MKLCETPIKYLAKITYLYAADGTKLSETITDGQMTHTFNYCGKMVYEDGLLSYILNPAGRALPTGQAHEYTYEYFLHDHLGNLRVVFGDPDHDHEAEVIQENHYYPFGMTMAGLEYSAGLESRYLYQGKECTGDFNLWWSDFHARRFDSQLGRWHLPDPAGQFASAYVGMGNNPVIGTDPDGMFVDKIKGSPLTGKQLYIFSKFLWFHGYRYNNGGWHSPQSMPLTMITSDYEQPWWERESEEQRARAVELSFRLDRMGISSTTHDGGIVVQYEWANGKEAGNILIKSWDEFYANFSNWVDNYATGEQVSSIKGAFGNPAGGGDNIQQAGFEGGEHLIGPGLIALGQPINLLKPIGALGSKSGSSVASYTLSKLLPFRSPLIKQATTSIFGLESSTAVLGRALGRLTPFIGWGMTVLDVSYNLIPLAVDKLILPLYPTSIVEENKKNAGHWAEVGVCFRVGTLVYGTNVFVPIEKIMVGDTVLLYNLEKSTIEPNRVERVFTRETQEIYELNTNNQKLFVTAQHPFYVEGKGWIKVKDLQKGDMLKTINNVKEQILDIAILKQTEIVYNIEVDGNHNYFVTNNTILVHNK